MSTYYTLLGIRQSADLDDIKKAFREFMRANHPDKTMHLPEDERRRRAALAKHANNAWECLGDARRREAYDAELLRQEQIERQHTPEHEPEVPLTTSRMPRDPTSGNMNAPSFHPPTGGQAPPRAEGNRGYQASAQTNSQANQAHPQAYQAYPQPYPQAYPQPHPQAHRAHQAYQAYPQANPQARSRPHPNQYTYLRPRSQPVPPMWPLPRSSNSIHINTRGWDFTIVISPKYFVVGDWSDQTASNNYAGSITIVLYLEPDKSWTKPIRSTQDATLMVQATPAGHDIVTISSLHHYPNSRVSKVYQTLSLTLTSPRYAKTPALSPQLGFGFAFAFDISPAPPTGIPSNARYVATHYMFSKGPPYLAHRTYTGQDKQQNIPPQCPEHKLDQIPELKPFEIVGEGVGKTSSRYQEVWHAGRKWHRLGCTGVRVE